MPVIHPAEIWQKSGRWDGIPEMFKLKDRWGRDMVLGMTHEEVIAWLAAREIRSYRDLPQIWYQIQTKERDEARPRSGVLRTREFVMKDSYTLDPDVAALDRSYALHEAAYRKIFERCGLTLLRRALRHRHDGRPRRPRVPGALRGRRGRDRALRGVRLRGQRRDRARGAGRPRFPPAAREEVATPGARTIAEVSALLKIDPRLTIKSLLYARPASGPVLVLLRGDHAMHERKLARAVGREFRPAQPDEIVSLLGAPAGSIGPGGRAGDRSWPTNTLRHGVYVVGANREGFHLRGVTPGRDFEARFVDLHAVVAGEACPQCGKPLGGREGDRGRQHLQAGHQVRRGAGRPVPRRVGQGAADRHGQLRHRPGPHRGCRHRAAGRRRRHRVARGHRAVPRAHRGRERARRRPDGRGGGDLRRLPEGRARRAAGRPRRAAGREVQGRRPDGDAGPGDDRQRAGQGGRGGGQGAPRPAPRAAGSPGPGPRHARSPWRCSPTCPEPVGSACCLSAITRAKVPKKWALPTFLLCWVGCRTDERELRIEEAVQPVLRDHGLDARGSGVAGAPSARGLLALFVDKPGGVGIEDCRAPQPGSGRRPRRVRPDRGGVRSRSLVTGAGSPAPEGP